MFTYLYFLLIIFISTKSITSTSYTCDINASCGCSTISTTDVTAKIVGGEIAPNRAWGWIVSLRLNGQHICGASLITSEFAVTAAHCLVSYVNAFQQLSILAGTNNLNDQSSSLAQIRTVLAIYIHPSYNTQTKINDIGLIRFASLSTAAGSTLAYICLPPANQDPFGVGDNLVAIGWGVLSFGSSSVPNALRQVTVQAIDSNAAICQRAPITNPVVEFCASVVGGGKDTCQGDSGGPLMAFKNSQWVLAGITSNGIGCALPDYSSLYTRVSSYIGYIQSVLDNPNVATSNSGFSTTTASAATASSKSPHSRVISSGQFSLILFLSSFILFSIIEIV